MSGNKYLLALVAGLVLLTTGCASNFVRPAPDALTLGKSKVDDVLKQVSGSPYRQNNVPVNEQKITLVSYMYTGNVPFYGSIIPRRTLIYSFYNDVLIGDELNSTYEDEKTEFDIKKVAEIHKGQTKDEVIATLGKPSGNIRYPLVTEKQGSGMVYAYTYSRFAPIVSPTWSYMLIVTLDQNNVVTNISFKEDGKEKNPA